MSDDDGAGSTVAVDFELTPEEWVEVCVEHSARSRLLRENVRKFQGLFGLLVLVVGALMFLGGYGPATVAWLAAGGVMTALLPRMVRQSHRKQYAQFAAEGVANGMFGPHRVELREDGMLDSTTGYAWLTRWSAIDRVEESEGAFLIYTGKNAFLPIPHSAFRDSATLRRFSERFYALRSGEDVPEIEAPVPPEEG